jgi:hypothetical protein
MRSGHYLWELDYGLLRELLYLPICRLQLYHFKGITSLVPVEFVKDTVLAKRIILSLLFLQEDVVLTYLIYRSYGILFGRAK